MKRTILTAWFAAVWGLFSFGQTPDRSRNYVMETVVRKTGVTDTAVAGPSGRRVLLDESVCILCWESGGLCGSGGDDIYARIL